MYPIPENATRVRYLGVSGTAYVMSGITFEDNQSARIKIWAGLTAYGSGAEMCGALQSASGSTPQINCTISSDSAGRYRASLADKGNATTTLDSGSNLASGLHTFDLSWNPTTSTATFVVDNSTTTTQILSGSIFPPLEIRIFGRNNGTGTTTTLNGNQILASCELWKNGTLVRSFVPVRVGSVGYLFDRVSGTLFGNAGSGDFTLGPDTFATGVVPTRMMVLGRDRMYDKEIQYIQSTGTQFIDTGIEADYQMGFEMQFTPFGSSATRMGAMSAAKDSSLNAYTRYYIMQDASNIMIALRTNSGLVSANPALAPGSTDVITASYTPATREASIGGKSTTAASQYSDPWTTGNNFFLFAQKQSAIQYHASTKLYYAKFWKNGVLVRDFISVRKGTTGYLYDKVSKQLFGSAGTGSFTPGPDK